MKFLRILSCLVLSAMLTLSLTACAKKEWVYAGVRFNEDKTPQCYLIKYTNVTDTELRLNFWIGYTYKFNGETSSNMGSLHTTEFYPSLNIEDLDEMLDAKSYTLKPNQTITLIFRPFRDSAALFFENTKAILSANVGSNWVSEIELEFPAMSTEQDFWDKLLPEYRPTDTPSVSIG